MNPGPADGTVGTDRTDSTNAHPGWSRGAGAVAVVALAVAYGVAGWLGLLVASDPGNVTALWPPSGIALASLLLWGRRLWPGVLLGAFVMNVVMFPNHSGDGVAILGAGLQSYRFPDCQTGRQAGCWLHARRTAERHHQKDAVLF